MLSFCCKPGTVWSFGGVGNTIGTSAGEPLAVALGAIGGVTWGYSVGVGVPGAPGVGAGVAGVGVADLQIF